MSRAINLRQYVVDPLERLRFAQALDDETVDVPPDEEGIAAVEDRAHTAAWHAYLAEPNDN